jgi:23S rRNA (cytidine1920-2'-O)/16S rRNA (cytidine1409-2'-O)-methyltransferase
MGPSKRSPSRGELSGRGPSKERLDQLLVARGLVESRSRAQALVMAGKVRVDGVPRTKPGERVSVEVALEVAAHDGWASRGAHKLLTVLESMPDLEASLDGARCLDIGASTGGFTDVMLRHGAAEVVAVDVGYGQLHWKLQSDARVTILDRTNIRHVTPDMLPWAPSFVTCDASFISVTCFLDVVWALMASGGVFVVLVKPQFEVGRERVARGGVVRDEGDRRWALDRVMEAATAAGFHVRGHEDSRLAGPKGNREILLVLDKPTEA